MNLENHSPAFNSVPVSASLPCGADFTGPIRLSVAAPAYNEEEGIRAIVLHWYSYLKERPEITEFEIVVCNDGSKDNTGAILNELAATFPEVRPVHFFRNQGAAAALTAAIAATRFEWVLLIDSDGQFPIENLPRLWAAIQSSATPAALGIRQKKDSRFTRFGTWASGIACNLVHGTRIKDFNSAFKLVWGPLLRSLSLEAKGMNYSTEVTSRLLECGVRLTEAEIEHRPRTTGKSSMKLIRGAVHRLLFVCYIALRQLLLRLEVLRRPSL